MTGNLKEKEEEKGNEKERENALRADLEFLSPDVVPSSYYTVMMMKKKKEEKTSFFNMNSSIAYCKERAWEF